MRRERTKKAAPELVPPERRRLESTEPDSACFQSNTSAGIRQAALPVESLLSHGRDKARTTDELLQASGLKTARQLRAEIERERAQGALILSTVRGRGGYFLPSADPVDARAELSEFVRTVHARAIHSQRTLRAARRALRECIGQAQIEEDGGGKT